MDHISRIVSALRINTIDTSSEAIEGLHRRLQTLPSQKLEDQSAAQELLPKFLESPEQWESALVAELRDSGIHQDEQVLQSADELIALAEADEIGPIGSPDASGEQIGKLAQSIRSFEEEEEE